MININSRQSIIILMTLTIDTQTIVQFKMKAPLCDMQKHNCKRKYSELTCTENRETKKGDQPNHKISPKV